MELCLIYLELHIILMYKGGMGSISNVRAKDYETKLVCVCVMIFIILIKIPVDG